MLLFAMILHIVVGLPANRMAALGQRRQVVGLSIPVDHLLGRPRAREAKGIGFTSRCHGTIVALAE
jgi:hypothetical protein